MAAVVRASIGTKRSPPDSSSSSNVTLGFAALLNHSTYVRSMCGVIMIMWRASCDRHWSNWPAPGKPTGALTCP